jgi:hypothetical protein
MVQSFFIAHLAKLVEVEDRLRFTKVNNSVEFFYRALGEVGGGRRPFALHESK